MGVSRQAVSLYAQGKIAPRKEIRKKLNELIGLPIEFLDLEERLEEALNEFLGFTSAGTKVSLEELAEDYNLNVSEIREFFESKSVKVN